MRIWSWLRFDTETVAEDVIVGKVVDDDEAFPAKLNHVTPASGLYWTFATPVCPALPKMVTEPFHSTVIETVSP
jgi:hypothetical protein